jgi:hypothetical protein
MPTCIYCRDELSLREFDKEHVIPRQFGGFENNQTLIHTVCARCNRNFSVTLEHALGRDSLEAIFRLRHGQKAVADFSGFAGERLQFRIPAGQPGAGVVVIPAPDLAANTIVLKLPPQVGIRHEGEAEHRYYTEEELRQDGPKLLPRGKKADVRLLVPKEDDAGLERLRGLVQALAPKFREEGELNLPNPKKVDGQIIVEVRGTIDKVITRAVAKIAFNYMAKQAGAAFALNACFDPIRRFIRYDEGGNDWRKFVRMISEPLLAEETEDLRITRGHVVQLGWLTLKNLQVRVSPYNSLAYEVTLTNQYDGLWRPLKAGHVFDWEHRTIHELLNPSRIVVPPGVARRAAGVYGSLVTRPRW